MHHYIGIKKINSSFSISFGLYLLG